MRLARRDALRGGFASIAVGLAPRIAKGDPGRDAHYIQKLIAAAAGGQVSLPSGVFVCGQIVVPARTQITGAGIGRTILLAQPGLDTPFVIAEEAGARTEITLRALTIDGNASLQMAVVHGMVFDRVTRCRLGVEVRNCRGTGVVFTRGGQNWFEQEMHVHNNGRAVPGYGLYLYGSAENIVSGGRYHANCIGIAVEAAANMQARRNRIDSPHCLGNRADFGQSGAGVHFEQSGGGDCDESILLNPLCRNSTGVGVANTGCALTIVGGDIRDNHGSAVATLAAEGILYSRISCSNNARGRSNGYRAEMRFDDTNVKRGTTGRVERCRLHGDAPDGGIRTMSRQSAISFVDNEVIGYRPPYALASPHDLVSRT